MSHSIRILHLSDLHLDVGSLRDQRVVLKALFVDLKRQIAQAGAYDFVFVTGDLIARGNYTESNSRALETEFILPLIENCDIDPSRLLIVPGNHDVDLKKQTSIIGNALKQICSNEDAAKYFDEVKSMNGGTGLEGFNALLKKLDPNVESKLFRTQVVEIAGVKYGIALLNSAWKATGAPNDGDYGKLMLGRSQLDDVVRDLEGSDFKFALVHHPLVWLSPKDSQSTQRQLLNSFDALFFGHNHEPDAQILTGTSNSYFSSNAGCLYQSRDFFNGYSSLTFYPRESRWEITAREYYEGRQEFDAAIRFAPNGQASFTRTRASSSQVVPQMPSDEFIDACAASFEGRLLPALVSDVAPKTLKGIFVEPLLSRVSQRKFSSNTKNGESGLFVPLKEVLQLKRHAVLIGASDMGKSTLLQKICAQCLEFSGDLPAFGAYVDLNVAGETASSLVDAIISFSGNAYRKSETIALLKAGAFCVCFDNLSANKSKQFKAVKEFCSTYSQCRFYWTMHEDVEYSLSPTRVPLVVAGDVEIFYIHPFGRKETRLLTQNWFGESGDDCADKVDDVLALLSRLNIPRSPFLISALLWIREKQTHFSPVNQAEILDALIDGVMEKLSETKDRSKIDSTIKRHYLAALAEHLHYSGQNHISSHELEQFTGAYFTSKGLPFTSGFFLEDLKAKGILLEVGEEVSFMFEAIRAFFLSTRLHENQALLEKALSPEHFLEFGEELDYYTGRHRDQTAVLSKSLAIVATFRAQSGLDGDLTEFERIRSKGRALSNTEAGRLKAAAQERPTAEQRHAMLDALDEKSHRKVMARGPVRKDFNSTPPSRQYLEALRIGSSILRNSELVGDVKLKAASYNDLTEGWCQILIGLMSSIEEDAETGSSFGIAESDPILGLLEGMLPADNPAMARYLRKLLLPNVIFSVALESIGTSKLQLVVEEHRKTTKFAIQRVMDVFLMVDLRLPNWVDRVDSLLKQFQKDRYVCELIFTKLFEIYMLGRLRVNEVDRIKSMLGEVVSLMAPTNSSREKINVKGRFISNLEKKRITRGH